MGAPKGTKSSSSSSSSEDEYIVEEILDHRVTRRGLEYYLKWKGFSKEESTWEPAANTDCRHLVAEYEEKRKAAEKEKRGSGSWKGKNEGKEKSGDGKRKGKSDKLFD